MVTKPEHFTDLQKKNMEAAMRLAQLSIENSQRIMELQVQAAKSLFDDGVVNAKALADARDPQSALSLRGQYAQVTTEKMLACARQIAEITAQTQAEFGRMVGEQLSSGSKDMLEAMQKAFTGMPVTTHNMPDVLQTAMDTVKAAYEQMTKVSTEAFGAFTSAAGQATTAATGAAKKTTKK